MPDCRMNHNDLHLCTRKRLDLMKIKMMDIKVRPQLGDQGKTGYNKSADKWVEKKKEASAAKREANKNKPCPNCNDGAHKQQECDEVRFPIIHEFCWMCNVHGHSSGDCRYYRKVGQWETNFDNRCQQAVKDNRVVWCSSGYPLTGNGKKRYKYELGRNIRGEGEWTPWTAEQLETRRAYKATEQAKMQPVVDRIRAKYPTLLPDAA